jgi:hypothetical protein
MLTVLEAYVLARLTEHLDAIVGAAEAPVDTRSCDPRVEVATAIFQYLEAFTIAGDVTAH